MTEYRFTPVAFNPGLFDVAVDDQPVAAFRHRSRGRGGTLIVEPNYFAVVPTTDRVFEVQRPGLLVPTSIRFDGRMVAVVSGIGTLDLHPGAEGTWTLSADDIEVGEVTAWRKLRWRGRVRSDADLDPLVVAIVAWSVIEATPA